MSPSGPPSKAISISLFDEMHEASVMHLLFDCCGSRMWVRNMIEHRPYVTLERLLQEADVVWNALRPDDWLEAFRAHPRIGEARAVGQSVVSARMSEAEQAAFAESNAAERAEFAQLNAMYEERFSHIFIICASGLSAVEVEARLRARLTNAPEQELRVAAEEQRSITRLRLESALEDG